MGHGLGTLAAFGCGCTSGALVGIGNLKRHYEDGPGFVAFVLWEAW